jgi:hypothetical protein
MTATAIHSTPAGAHPFHHPFFFLIHLTDSSSQVKVSVTLLDSFYITSNAVMGNMELEYCTDIGLRLGIIMVKLITIEGRQYYLLAPSLNDALLLTHSKSSLACVRRC